MKQQILIVGLLLSVSIQAWAQQPSTTTVPVSVATPTAATTDTIQAVRQLFSKRRTGGWVWSSIGVAAIVRISTAGAADGNAADGLVGAAVVGGIPAAIGVGKLTRFSKAREEGVLATYQQNKQLPTYVRRRLKQKYFPQ